MSISAINSGIKVPAEELRKLRMGLLAGMNDGNQFAKPGYLDRILNAYLGYLNDELSDANRNNIGQVKEMLLEVASAARVGNVGDKAAEFGHFIDGLVAIYSRGSMQDGLSGYLLSAEDYADAIESISSAFPTYDYDETLEQLFLYMSLLFTHHHKGWVGIYAHVLSMPETVRQRQSHKLKSFQKISEWIDGGVQNLFQIQSNFAKAQHRLQMREQLLIQQLERLQQAYLGRIRAGNVIDLKHGKRVGVINLLRKKQKALNMERLEKERLVILVDSNVQEFKNLMAVARRSMFMRLVPKSEAGKSKRTQNRSISPHSIPCSSANLPSLIKSS